MDIATVNHRRTRIKICGITRLEDALEAAAAGADAVGFVFYASSSRSVAPATAAAIARSLPPFVTSVGLFVNASADTVRDVLRTVSLGILQFHGDEPAEYCRQFGLPYMKAIRIRLGTDLLQYQARYPDAAAMLLDAYVSGVPGGTGETFDWNLVPAQMNCQIVLSGGLTGDNVAAGIEHVHPWAVDVSSGVELAPGVKDGQLIRRFVAAVRWADTQAVSAG